MRLNAIHRVTLIWLVSTMLLACQSEEVTVPGRWYTPTQVSTGQTLFQTHCASCHGDRAQGLADDWRKTDADGNYPAPPLNGSAHAWHHPMSVLEQTINRGGAPIGGVMPGFDNTFDQDQVRATIAYIQSLWRDETYTRWEEINAR